ncbi:hypothetical protein [Streptosporangium sp. NPDC000396]|uniref:YqeB family protein n=1 Tax=Streptosporangium sp. NPDC000396 TaxID=3366185 RepID=UPI0036BEAFEA
MPPEPGSQENATVVGPTTSERALVWIGFPLLGGAGGWALKALALWAVSLPWVPFHGPLKLFASLPDQVALIGSLALGVLAGVVLVFLAEKDYVTVKVEDDQVTLTRGGSSRTVPRASISGVFLEDKRLVLLGHAAEELAGHSAHHGADLPDAKGLAEAFTAHRYPWLPGGDPYKDEYRRWVEDMPGLPPAANALFKARARALDKNDVDDITQLRDELATLGIVVRDEKKRQFWRHTHQPTQRPGNTPTP